MKKNPVMITPFLKKFTITVIGNVIRMPFANKVTCDHRTRSGASRVHLLSNVSERRSNTDRKTLNPTTRAKSHTE